MRAASCLAAPRKVDKKCQCFSALENIYIFTRLNIVISVSNPSLLHGAQPPSRLMATLSPWSALQTWTLIFTSTSYCNGHIQFSFSLAGAQACPQSGTEPVICAAHMKRGQVGFAKHPSGAGGGTDRLGRCEGGTCSSLLSRPPHKG